MPSREQLHKYQARMIDFIYTTPKCALWAGLGLGKTITTLNRKLVATRVFLKKKLAHKAHLRYKAAAKIQGRARWNMHQKEQPIQFEIIQGRGLRAADRGRVSPTIE